MDRSVLMDRRRNRRLPPDLYRGRNWFETVRRLMERQPQRVWRIECQPGKRCRLISGWDAHRARQWQDAPQLDVAGDAYVTRAKAKSEAVMRQDTESFLRCLENALGNLAAPRSCAIWII